MTYYEIGKITFEDEAVEAVVESRDELPPMDELSDVEAPSTEDLELPEEVGDIRGLDEVSQPWSGLEMQPWETEGGTASLLS